MAEELAENVYWLDVGLVRPLATNAFLVEDGSVTLIDTGLWVNRPSLRSELADAGYEPADVDRVLLTHYDLDHTTGLRGIRPAFDGPIFIGEVDHDLSTGRYDPPLLHHKGLFHRIARRLFPLPRDADVRGVVDGDVLGEFTVYDTPGHNPGHVAYVHDSGAAFVGDLVWETDGELTTPVWLDSYDTGQIRESITDFAARAPTFDVLAMGHGAPLTADAHRAFLDLAGRL